MLKGCLQCLWKATVYFSFDLIRCLALERTFLFKKSTSGVQWCACTVFLWFLWLDWATRQVQVPLPVSPRSVLYFLSEGWAYCVVQATLGLLSLSDPPSSAALVVRTVSVCYLTYSTSYASLVPWGGQVLKWRERLGLLRESSPSQEVPSADGALSVSPL